MNSATRHILSKPILETTYDQKERAFELQQRLSAWSRTVMPLEAAAVFDALCPPEQCWSIPALTVNLGAIDFLNMEAELSIKLRKQLLEELTNLVIRNNNVNSALMTITDQRSAQLEALIYFLNNGVLPLNCPLTISYHEILTNQLQNNHTAFITMIRETGGSSRVVRRRLAWQTHEPNLKKIIAGLEPSNHQQVVGFATELTRLQAVQNIVHANAGELQKEIWLWILDYLLTERGTLFNQKEMMKSSIRQMAAHYNIAYNQLFVLIQSAAKRISERQGIKAEFLTLLYALESEQKAVTLDYWAQLSNYFSDSARQGARANVGEFNELVNRLSRQDRGRFARQIAAVSQQTNGWCPAMDVLDETALSCIFSAVNGNARSAELRDIVALLGSLAGKDSREVWRVGFALLNRYPTASLSPEFFLDNLLVELRKKIKTVSLLHAEIALGLKTPANLEIYKGLYGQADPKLAKELLDELYRLLKQTIVNQNRVTAVRDLLEIVFNSKPRVFIDTLTAYQPIGKLKIILPHLMDMTLSTALYNAFPELAALAAIFNRWKDHPLYAEVANLCIENLPEVGLLQMRSNGVDFTQRTLAEVFYRLPTRMNEPLQRFKILLGGTMAEQQQSGFKKAMALVKMGDIADRGSVVRLLRSVFNDPGFTRLRATNNARAKGLLNYLMSGSGPFNIDSPLERDVLWSVILDSIFYQGDLKQLKSDYENAARLRLASPIWIAEGQIKRQLKGSKLDVPRIKDLKKVLEFNPSLLRTIIASQATNEKFVEQLSRAFSFNSFAGRIAADTGGSLAAAARSYRSLYELAIHLFGNTDLPRSLQKLYWQQLFEVIHLGTFSSTNFEKLVKTTFEHLVHEQLLDTAAIITIIKHANIHFTPTLINALALYNSAFEFLKEMAGETLTTVETANLLYTLSLQLIMDKRVPDWYRSNGVNNAGNLLNALLREHSEQFFTVIKYEPVTESGWQWMHRTANFSILTRAMGILQPNRRMLLNMITDLYKALGQLSVNGVTTTEVQYFLFKKVINAWRTSNWTTLFAGNILNELIWDITLKKGIKQTALLAGLNRVKLRLPLALQVSLSDKWAKPRQLPVLRLTENKTGEAIPVNNAGLVLLNTYIPLLFERLVLTTNGRFAATTMQEDAVHYLQYLATGLNGTEEILLPLNKVLCGLPLAYPVPYELNMQVEHIELIDGLIGAAIGHWGAIGDSSVDGFRGNWLVRGGLLTEQTDKWELAVEKRAYDLLLYQSPYSFTIINYPWMNKPLYVSWPY